MGKKKLLMSNPSVSVIIAVYNGAKFLAEAVGSIRQQSYKPIEIIIIDDGSTDGTAELASDLGDDVRYIYQSNNGPAAARNKGLALARGEVIAFLDVDDLWPLDKLQNQIPRILDDPKLDVVLGRIKVLILPGVAELDSHSPDTQINVHLGCAIFRKSVFDKVGNFDETLRYSEDHDWFLRAREQSVSMTIVDQVTLYYQLHGKNMTNDKDVNDFQLTQVLKNSLDRRRQQGNGKVKKLPKLSDLIADSSRTSAKETEKKERNKSDA